MGTIALQNYSGHIGIHWDANKIEIDLEAESKSNSNELSSAALLVKKALESGFSAVLIKDNKEKLTLDQNRVDIPRRATKIVLTHPVDAKGLIENVVRTSVIAPFLLVKINKDGNGECIQKTEFKPDENDYIALGPQRGG